MRATPSIVHVDLDAFFASVEQRDKPSLRGKPVIVGGTGARGVVSTASYEARAYGARSAMSTAAARSLCPSGTAFLAPRFEAYQRSSGTVMRLLRSLSPAVEQVSIDEAYIDLSVAATDVDGSPVRHSFDDGQNDDYSPGRLERGTVDRLTVQDLSVSSVEQRLRELQRDVSLATGGLTISAGAASSKMMAKIASELRKPAGICVIEPGTEQEILEPMSVRAISGVGPATEARLKSFGIETVGQLRRMSSVDLVSVFGEKHGRSLYALARAQDDRPLSLSREAKSISAEETFEVDVRDRAFLETELAKIAERVAERMKKSGVFARTVHLKVRSWDFSILTRSTTTPVATGSAEVLTSQAVKLLTGVDVSDGVRLIGLGASGFVPHSQDELFLVEGDAPRTEAPLMPEAVGVSPNSSTRQATYVNPSATRFTPGPATRWRTGQDVRHGEFGSGWVWGSGRGRVTIRFEGPLTAPGPVRTFAVDDPRIEPADPPDWAPPQGAGEFAR